MAAMSETKLCASKRVGRNKELISALGELIKKLVTEGSRIGIEILLPTCGKELTIAIKLCCLATTISVKLYGENKVE